MKILLLNSTPIVTKLVRRLADMRGDQLTEDAHSAESKADVVIIDDSVMAAYPPEAARRLGTFALFMGSRFDPVPNGYDGILLKPFLPRELDDALSDAAPAFTADSIASHTDINPAQTPPDATEKEAVDESVFNQQDIETVKSLLENVETSDDSQAETAVDDKIAAALDAIDNAGWSQPFEEVLYDADEESSDTTSTIDKTLMSDDAMEEAIQRYAQETETLHETPAELAGETLLADDPQPADDDNMPEQTTDDEISPITDDLSEQPTEDSVSKPSPTPPEPTDDFAQIDLHARGFEALQDLMAILSDPSVAKAFKTIGVRVDISFGEKN